MNADLLKAAIAAGERNADAAIASDLRLKRILSQMRGIVCLLQAGRTALAQACLEEIIKES
jgi:hypothetical protein